MLCCHSYFKRFEFKLVLTASPLYPRKTNRHWCPEIKEDTTCSLPLLMLLQWHALKGRLHVIHVISQRLKKKGKTLHLKSLKSSDANALHHKMGCPTIPN